MQALGSKYEGDGTAMAGRLEAELLEEIGALAARLRRPIRLMEVCGTHTHAVAAAGLRQRLPAFVRLGSGPGCPVCVTPASWIQRAIGIGREHDARLCAFGDLLRVPALHGSLETARAEGLDVATVYSPREALTWAQREPARRTVFLAIGFETTAPLTAALLIEARAKGVDNLLVFSGHKTMPAALEALVDDRELRVDGLILPGHVAAITGSEAFRFLPERLGLPAAVAGFEPADLLGAVLALLRQIVAGRPRLVNGYARVVTPGGNSTAQRLMDRVFVPASDRWRGLGSIPASGLALGPGWQDADAGPLAPDEAVDRETAGCLCGEILRGRADPPDCPLFGGACRPDRPAGACMVSSEGACAAWHRHERRPR